MTQLIGLERRSYLAAMRAIRTFVTGLHRLGDDLELAYTLVVASLESLAQGFDGYRATWADYEENKRASIDVALEGAKEEIANRVRDALLEIEHVSLMRRFRDFTLAHLRPSFFREEADALNNPVGRAELGGALQTAYGIRSKYIHNLQELPRILTMGGGIGDTARTEDGLMLTFEGLARVARHVIFEFVSRQPKVSAETYDYFLEQPGIIQVRIDPRYWLDGTKGLKPEMGRSRLNGFLQQLAGVLMGLPDAKLSDMRAVLAAIEAILQTMKADQRWPWVVLYLLFNHFVPKELQMPRFNATLEKHGALLEEPSVESLIAHLVLGSVPTWQLSSHQETHDAYFRRRDRKNGIQAPRVLEAGLSLTLAERYRLAGNLDRARELIGFAVDNHPGHAPLRELERSFSGEVTIHWRLTVLPPEA